MTLRALAHVGGARACLHERFGYYPCKPGYSEGYSMAIHAMQTRGEMTRRHDLTPEPLTRVGADAGAAQASRP